MVDMVKSPNEKKVSEQAARGNALDSDEQNRAAQLRSTAWLGSITLKQIMNNLTTIEFSVLKFWFVPVNTLFRANRRQYMKTGLKSARIANTEKYELFDTEQAVAVCSEFLAYTPKSQLIKKILVDFGKDKVENDKNTVKNNKPISIDSQAGGTIKDEVTFAIELAIKQISDVELSFNNIKLLIEYAYVSGGDIEDTKNSINSYITQYFDLLLAKPS